jgi:hypothetical protein
MNLRNRCPRRPLRLSLCVAALLALGACSDSGSDSASNDAPQTPVSSSDVSESPSPSSEAPESPSPSPSSDAPESPSPSTGAESPSAPPTVETPPRLIAYAGGESPGVQVQERADAKKLHGAPADFKRFIGDLAQRLADMSDCSKAYVGVTVETLRTDGYAVGGINECGGYQALWAVVDGHWKEIQGTQDSWACAGLKRYQVPSDVVGTSCYDYGAKKQRSYHQS